MKRLAASTAFALIAVTGCTAGTTGGSTSVTSSSTSSGSSTTTSACTSKTAKSVRQVLVSTGGFDATCVKAAVGKQVFFVNSSDKAQSLKTAAGAPESFMVDLPKKTSTYVRAFKTKGTYVIEQSGGKTALTLLVG